MSMSLRLSDDAVQSSSYHISEDALRALQAGDPEALLRSHRGRWADLSMMAKDDDVDDDDSDEDDDDDSDDDGDDDEDSDDDDDDDEDEDGPEGKKSKKADKDKRDDSPEGLKRKISALEDEKNRLYRGRTRARARVDELEKEVQKLKADAPGDDDLKKEVGSLEKSVETLTGSLQEARLKIAFLSDNSYQWQNPGLALKAADLSDVEIDDDGKVHGLTAALEKLASENEYLLKKEEKPKRTPAGKTGSRPGPKSSKTKQAERAKVAEKYGIRR